MRHLVGFVAVLLLAAVAVLFLGVVVFDVIGGAK